MFGRKKAARKGPSGDALSGVHARLTELSGRESRIHELVARFDEETKAARTATLAAARAREERDEYRRVLAAAIAREQRAESRLAAVDRERLEATERAAEERAGAARAAAERDTLSQRVDALEALVREQSEAFERTLADTQDRAWSEREATRAELMRLTGEARRGAAEVAREVREVLERGGPPAPPVAAVEAGTITGMRRRLFVGLGLGAGAVGIALAPSAILAAMDGERAMFVHLASGLSPWHVLVLSLLAFAAAGALLTLARRDALAHA